MSIEGKCGKPPGLPKTGGRTKGTPNRATAALKDKLAALGYDPLEELVRVAQNPKTSVVLKVHICEVLLPYEYPKRKPQDSSSDERPVINVNTNLDKPGDSADERDKSQS